LKDKLKRAGDVLRSKSNKKRGDKTSKNSEKSSTTLITEVVKEDLTEEIQKIANELKLHIESTDDPE
jgi:hypothetical protein